MGLAVGALVVVFGDSAPTPVRHVAFEGHGHQLAVIEDNVLGLLSLVFWSLVLARPRNRRSSWASPSSYEPTSAFPRATDANQAALGFGSRTNVWRSTATRPNRGR